MIEQYCSKPILNNKPMDPSFEMREFGLTNIALNIQRNTF